MTILEALMKLVGASSGMTPLIEVLRKASDAAPDLKPKIDEWIKVLEAIPSTSNMVALASVLPKEIANILQGKFDPRRSPHQAI